MNLSLGQAIALFLFTWIQASWAFDKSDLSFMRANNMLEREVFIHSGEWEVKPLKLNDFVTYKGQGSSLIDWNELDHNKWLDFNQWKAQREIREGDEQWRIKARDLLHKEVIGRVIQCLNDCDVHTGSGASPAQYGSLLKEGDELITQADSYAWLFLVDGTVARLSPNSSLSLQEVNLAKGKVFLCVRLNQGHAYFQHRKLGEFKKIDRPESDLAMLPLLEKKANREYYARLEYKGMEESERLRYSLEPNQGYVSQYDELNKQISGRGEKMQLFETEMFFYTANASFILRNASFHVFHQTGGDTWIKLEEKISGLERDDPRQATGQAFFRGYTNRKSRPMELGAWYTMNREGSAFRKGDPGSRFAMVELFVKRIPSIQLAREYFLRRNSSFVFEDWDRKKLAMKHGYRLWDEETELSQRKAFLQEYIRRVETTNLRSYKSVFGERQPPGFGRKYYIEAVNRNLAALKSLHSNTREVVKESNEAEYYLWIVKHAKDFMPTYFR